MSREEINKLCDQYNIQNYTINDDGSIDVDGDVDLSKKGLTELPLKFNYISGDFNCAYNKITDLTGYPKNIGGNTFIRTGLIGNPIRSIISGVVLTTNDNREFLQILNTYKVIKGDTVHLNRLKYTLSIFDKKINVEWVNRIKKHYKVI
tara:strand:- start:2335 stop:2781 length:447 start_codon:yes stop_codon:yes gene_type:complete